jgi:uncharacterized protein YutE (UPF0331/DUF86 family)
VTRIQLRTERIRIKLAEMMESEALVRSHLPETAEEFSRLGLVKDGIYKRVEYAIENVFDVCAILNADLKLGIPGTDEAIVDHLILHGILTPGMKERLKAMKGFRNIVVHRYGAIDDALAYMILRDHIGDFALFRQEIEAFLENQA